MRPVAPILIALCLVPFAGAHGDLELNELETLVIRDFEGHEDSFPWEGFEIWDVYVGEGYNETLDSDGMYFKANFAGDGTLRPSGGKLWTVTFTWLVGEEPFERQFTHDGTTITTDFESFQSVVADGNVLQVKAWVPITSWVGMSVTEIVLVSSVDGTPRDTAPGGVHDPATGQEVPISAPSTVVFPPMGEGRIVNEVLLTGPAKYLDVTMVDKGDGQYKLTVTNTLKEQGQHVFLYTTPMAGWNMTSTEWSHNLNGAAAGEFDISLTTVGGPGESIEPFKLDFVTDIGGHRTIYAYMTPAGVVLTEDAATAQAASMPDLEKVPAPGIFGALAMLALVAVGIRSKRS